MTIHKPKSLQWGGFQKYPNMRDVIYKRLLNHKTKEIVKNIFYYMTCIIQGFQTRDPPEVFVRPVSHLVTNLFNLFLDDVSTTISHSHTNKRIYFGTLRFFLSLKLLIRLIFEAFNCEGN